MLESANIDFDVIFWNRAGVSNTAQNTNEKEITITCRNGRIGKLVDFLFWRLKILKLLKGAKYEYLIVLSTMPAVLLSGFILKKYKERYLFDIRDYTLEQNIIFSQIITMLVKHSDFTTISSAGFMQWLKPSPKIVPNHNITNYTDGFNKEIRLRRAGKVIFTFVGNIRLDRQTEAALLNLKNSTRYVSGFVGRILPSCNIKKFCQDNNITNVYFGNQFSNADKAAIYRDVDIINAIYANESVNIRPADSTPLPNRVYDAALYQCPIVASSGTYLAELIQKYDLGFSVDGFDTDLERQFDAYIDSFDEERFRAGCRRFLDYVLEEEAVFRGRFERSMAMLLSHRPGAMIGGSRTTCDRR